MALFKPFRGNSASLAAVEKHDGYAYFCTDTGEFFIDYADTDGELHRKQINADEANKLVGYNIATILNSSDIEIPTSNAVINALNQQAEQFNEAILNSQANWDETNPASASYIKNKPDEEDALELVTEIGLIDPITDENGAVYTDTNGVIYTI